MKNTLSDKEAWEGHADCLSCTLRNSVLFAGLEEKDFENIHQPIDLYTLPPGATLYRAGDPGEYGFYRLATLVLCQQWTSGFVPSDRFCAAPCSAAKGSGGEDG